MFPLSAEMLEWWIRVNILKLFDCHSHLVFKVICLLATKVLVWSQRPHYYGLAISWKCNGSCSHEFSSQYACSPWALKSLALQNHGSGFENWYLLFCTFISKPWCMGYILFFTWYHSLVQALELLLTARAKANLPAAICLYLTGFRGKKGFSPNVSWNFGGDSYLASNATATIPQGHSPQKKPS